MARSTKLTPTDEEIQKAIAVIKAAGGSVDGIQKGKRSTRKTPAKSPAKAPQKHSSSRTAPKPAKSLAKAKKPKETQPEPEEPQPAKKRKATPTKSRTRAAPKPAPARAPAPKPEPVKLSKTAEKFKRAWRREIKDWKAEGISANEALRRLKFLRQKTHPERPGLRRETFLNLWGGYNPRRVKQPAETTAALQKAIAEPVPQSFDGGESFGEMLDLWETQLSEEEDEPEEITNVVLYGFVIKDDGEYAIIHGGEHAPDPKSGNYWFKGRLDVSDVFDLVEKYDVDRMWKVGNRNRVTVGIEKITEREFMNRHPGHELISHLSELQKRIHSVFDALNWHEKGDITGKKRSHHKGKGVVPKIESPYRKAWAARMGKLGQTTITDEAE